MVDLDFALPVLIIAVILSVMHHYSHIFSKYMEKNHFAVLSFSGGTLIAFIFLVLLPEVIAVSVSMSVFLLILLGYLIFFISEKYLYQHVKNKNELLRELKYLHIAGFFADHYMLGFLLVTALKLGSHSAVLVLLPIFLHTISSTMAMVHIHEKARTNFNKIILSLSPILGALTALALDFDEHIQALVLAFLIGMLLFIVNRDILPRDEKGRLDNFIMGVVLIVVIIFLLGFM